jgi:heavy metal sensor kinase
MIRSFRLQLTAWYLLLFAALFVGFSLFLYGLLARGLHARLDETMASEARTLARLFQDELGEHNGDAAPAAAEAISDLSFRGAFLAIFEGKTQLAGNNAAVDRALLELVGQAGSGEREVRATILSHEKTELRAIAYPLRIARTQYVVLLAESLRATNEELAMVRNVLLVGVPLFLLIAGAGGFLLTTRGLAPLGRMAAQARAITDQNLHQRLNAGAAHEELRALADSFNELLSRLDQSFETMRRFVADASHELRTPLSVIRGEADVALGQDRSPGEYQESLVIIQDEARRLSRLVDDLLNLARADAGHVSLRVEEFYLNDLVADCCRAFQGAAGVKDIELECRCPGDVAFRGDQELLRRLIWNLLDNAIRYTPPGGKVTAKLQCVEGEMRIQVADTGIGIPPEAAPHIFERFYRGDQARSRQNGGFGLGLSIVKWIAESHRGAVDFTSLPGEGTTFTVLLHQ